MLNEGYLIRSVTLEFNYQGQPDSGRSLKALAVSFVGHQFAQTLQAIPQGFLRHSLEGHSGQSLKALAVSFVAGFRLMGRS